mmetsp:Transcript_41336/g.93126  ORF Transcript_41336/g.93126 Transcript_41336/m.93126 type:complete len:332 (+) Transcript_41336:313-1308(+)
MRAPARSLRRGVEHGAAEDEAEFGAGVLRGLPARGVGHWRQRGAHQNGPDRGAARGEAASRVVRVGQGRPLGRRRVRTDPPCARHRLPGTSAGAQLYDPVPNGYGHPHDSVCAHLREVSYRLRRRAGKVYYWRDCEPHVGGRGEDGLHLPAVPRPLDHAHLPGHRHLPAGHPRGPRHRARHRNAPPHRAHPGLRDLQTEPASEGGDEAFGRARQARERSPSGRARCQVLPLGGEFRGASGGGSPGGGGSDPEARVDQRGEQLAHDHGAHAHAHRHAPHLLGHGRRVQTRGDLRGGLAAGADPLPADHAAHDDRRLRHGQHLDQAHREVLAP